MPTFPGETALRRERAAVLETFRSLRPEEFEAAPTLCDGWAPRDVLAHLLDREEHPAATLRALGRSRVANTRAVARARLCGRGELLARAALWARYPTHLSRIRAWELLGETALHHEDVLVPMGRTREIPAETRRAMLRTAACLAPGRLAGHRLVPTDLEGSRLGLGRLVRGRSDVLALWLSGRSGLEDELEFG